MLGAFSLRKKFAATITTRMRFIARIGAIFIIALPTSVAFCSGAAGCEHLLYRLRLAAMMPRGAGATLAAVAFFFTSSSRAQSATTSSSSEADACSAAEAGLDDHPEVEQMRAVFVQSRLTALQNRTATPIGRQQGASELGSAQLLRSGRALSMTADQRAEFAVPLAWFHVPKTGTSFCNALYHTPTVCRSFPRGELHR
ncbi:unnamed protein product [Prorocentrum cordatum]|uniref:Phospholipase B-like n=1 Tax=Prorocentrum cordatum TaxID=2364126 RepID=A0ABN9WEV7_9DINO|nr:unnamed protein product [Polarella glacialis]